MARENRGERNIEKIWRSHYIEGEDRHVQREICDMHDRVGDMLRVERRLSRVAPVWLEPALRRGRHGGGRDRWRKGCGGGRSCSGGVEEAQVVGGCGGRRRALEVVEVIVSTCRRSVLCDSGIQT